MDQAAQELIKKVRKIEIKTRRLTNHIFAGEYHSAFKGKGMTFSEVRGYQYGDDIRNIDWNVTARFKDPYIKIYEEEREMTVMLLVDTSGSSDFGTRAQMKKELITEVAAVMSFSAIHNNDKIGMIFFSDRVEKFIPPKKGRKHILHLIREMLAFEPQSKRTDISEAIRYMNNAIKKRATAFVISDFMDEGFEDALSIANKKHDMIALKIADPREAELPNIGLVRMLDPETGQERWIDTSLKKVRRLYGQHWHKDQRRHKEAFRRSGVDFAELRTGEDYVKPLMQLFKQR